MRNQRIFLSGASGSCELVPEFGHLNEVCFNSLSAALVAKRLRQMGLPSPSRANESQISVSIDCGEGRQILQPLNIPPSNHREVKILKGLRILTGQMAQPQKGLDGRISFLIAQVVQNQGHRLKPLCGQPLVFCQSCKFLGTEVQLQSSTTSLNRFKHRISHPSHPPCQS